MKVMLKVMTTSSKRVKTVVSMTTLYNPTALSSKNELNSGIEPSLYMLHLYETLHQLNNVWVTDV